MRSASAYLRKRVSRPLWFCTTGRQVLAPSVSMLTAAEQKRVPPRLVNLLEVFPERLAEAPPPFEWLAEALDGRQPVLECARIDDREHWSVRLSDPLVDRLSSVCFGFDAKDAGPCPSAVPHALAWMRDTFGTFDLVPELSGTAPFGRTLAEVIAQERAQAELVAAELEAAGFPFHDRWAELRAELPPEADDWVSLYEVDGDYVFADVARNETVWLGAEWTGEADTRFDLPWARAASFSLWRMIDGGHLRPVDLRMLATRS